LRSKVLVPSLAVLLTLVLAPMASATSPAPFLTTGLTHSMAAQGTLAGFQGVTINYTDTRSTGVFAFVYMDLTNSAGQTVLVQATTGNFTAGQSLVLFLPISGVGTGTYSASVFATNIDGVPISTVTTVQVVL
jgi:hypothetical protein